MSTPFHVSTDVILDLIVDTEETRKEIVDFYGKKEVIYLGPDEQVGVKRHFIIE